MTVADPPRERLVQVPVDQIEVGPRHRVQKDVTALKAAVQRRGLMHPITVTPRDATPPFSFKLAAGAGRLRAFKELGRDSIPAFVRDLDALEAEEVEITENLIRNDLTVLEQAEHLLRYEEILRERGERAERGDNRFTLGRPDNGVASTDEIEDFDGKGEPVPVRKTSDDLSAEQGMGRKTWERRVRIARELSQEVRDLLRETEVADSQLGLMEIVRQDTEEKRLLVAQTIASGKAQSVGDAIRLLDGGEPERKRESSNDGPGSDVGERYKVVRLEGSLRYPTQNWHMRTRTIKGEERVYPREDEWVERNILLTTDERALEADTGLDFLVEDLTRQLRRELEYEGYPRR